MNEEQKKFMSFLDKNGTCGTTQAVIMDLESGKTTFEEALKFLCTRYKGEKETLVKDNVNLSRNLNSLLSLARTLSIFEGSVKQVRELSKKVLENLK